MKIALYGASDRYNYGDILMPIVFKEWFDRNSKCEIKYINCALIDSEMEYCGGFNTIGIKNIPKVDAIVVTGGEVTGTILSDITSNTFSESQKLKTLLFKVLRKLIPVQLNHYLTKKYGTDTPYLFAVNANNNITIYNTVGGSMSYRKETTRREFETAVSYTNKASYISCRTEYDRSKLKEVMDVPVHCYPDSVILLSTLFPKSKLKEVCREEILKLMEEKYYVFQSYNLTVTELESVAKAIKSIYKRTKMKCFLLPIAYAQNHGDVQALLALHNMCKEASIFPCQTTIFETASILAHSEAYCGTSLHGVITAISYTIPHCTWRANHYKTIRFLESWGSSKYIYADHTNVEDVILDLLYDEENKELLKRKNVKMVDLANENFRNIEKVFLDRIGSAKE